MFNDKPYYDVNREERFYCFLLCHSLLKSNEVREKFAELIKKKTTIKINANDLEVYIEAAVLRDFWYDLGSPKNYDDGTHSKRRDVLVALLGEFTNLPETVIDDDDYDFLWTKGSPKKLWIPGHWNETSINKNKAGLKPEIVEKLCKIKWAFNAKPDIMLVSNNTAVLIEAKLESIIGSDNRGYNQIEIQELTTRLIKHLSPFYHNYIFGNLFISKYANNHAIAWKEIAEIITKSDVDKFTKQCINHIS